MIVMFINRVVLKNVISGDQVKLNENATELKRNLNLNCQGNNLNLHHQTDTFCKKNCKQIASTNETK